MEERGELWKKKYNYRNNSDPQSYHMENKKTMIIIEKQHICWSLCKSSCVFVFLLPAVVFQQVCVNDVSQRQTKKAESCLD